MKLAVLWSEVTSYLRACLRTTKSHGTAVSLGVAQAPPEKRQGIEADVEVSWLGADPRPDEVVTWLQDVAPDVLLVGGWHVRGFRLASARRREWNPTATRVLGFDNPWRGTPRQRMACRIADRYLHPSYDAAFVPGRRQRHFAMRLGFDPAVVRTGLYVADGSVYRRRMRPAERQQVCYVGRLAPEKGIDVLAGAFSSSASGPYRLEVVGDGQLAPLLRGLSRVRLGGWQAEPSHVADTIRASRALLLPSSFEPWGVVVHEAMSCGVPVIATDSVGAADDLIHHGINGWVGRTGSVADVVDGIRWLDGLTSAEYEQCSHLALASAATHTLDGWHQTICSFAERLG